jgi:hypothetical protein
MTVPLALPTDTAPEAVLEEPMAPPSGAARWDQAAEIPHLCSQSVISAASERVKDEVYKSDTKR